MCDDGIFPKEDDVKKMAKEVGFVHSYVESTTNKLHVQGFVEDVSVHRLCDWEFHLEFFPGNRRFLVSTESWVREEFRHRGIGHKMMDLKKKIVLHPSMVGCIDNLPWFRNVPPPAVIATVRHGNLPEIALLQTCGWKNISETLEYQIYILKTERT